MQHFWMTMLILTSLSACTQQKGLVSTYWVNGTQVDCMGVGPRKCLQVQKTDEIDEQAWVNFFAKIEGFDYEAGYIYKLQVKEEQLPADQVPADASSVKYTLMKVLEKTPDIRFDINGDWMLIRLDGAKMNRMMTAPTMLIDLGEMHISGNGGCNNYTTGIKSIGSTSISIRPAAGTRRACIKDNVEHQYFIALGKVTNYKIEGDKLIFTDENGTELLAFLKGVSGK